VVQLLEELSALVDNPGRGENEQPPISEYHKEVTPLGHLTQSGSCPPAYDYTYESLFYGAFNEGRQIKEAEDHNEEFKKIFQERMKTSKCCTTDSSKMEENPFVGFAPIDVKDGHSMKSRISKIASTFMAEALAIGKTLEIIKKIDSEQNCMIFSHSASVLKGISNSSTMNDTSHVTHMLKDKIERLESRGKKIQFHWIPGHCSVEGIERADSEAKQAIKEGKDSQVLLPMADLKTQSKKKDKEEQFLSKHQMGQGRKQL
jgi:ribonuclease HI